MLQGNTIYVRRESLRRMLWEKVDSWLWNRPQNAMQRALSFYDIEGDLDAALDELTDNEVESVILHEIGEYIAGQELGPDWQRLMAANVRCWGGCLSTIGVDVHPSASTSMLTGEHARIRNMRNLGRT